MFSEYQIMKTMKVNGINHLNISVRDPERSSQFYCEVFGMKEAFREMPDRIFLQCGRDLLTFAKGKSSAKSGVHFGFRVRGRRETLAWKRWLKTNHVKIDRERLEEAGGSIYFKDPDGYLIEIYYER
jgi:catechol 2,3-dioxygenase-like lactoylglutathione lyase family enzyme